MDDKIFNLPVLRGVSITVPKERVTIKDLNFDGVNVDNVIKTTGVKEVRRAPEDKTATDYSINAAEHLFKALNFDKSQIDGIVFATPIPDYLTPGSGYVVQEILDIPTNCVIFDTNQACAGFVNGLFQAFMLVQSGYCKNVLVCAGDTASGIHTKDKSLRMLLGDAGTASIVSVGDGSNKSAFSFYNDGRLLKALYIPAGGKRIPRKIGVTDVESVDEYGNIRTLENTYMDGLEVMSFALTAAPRTIKDLYNIMGWTKDDVEIFALHQAGATMLKALTKRLKVPAEKVPVALTYYGNMAGASIPLTLCLESPNSKGSWEKSVLCAFGNGMACAAVALDLRETYFCEVHEF